MSEHTTRDMPTMSERGPSGPARRAESGME